MAASRPLSKIGSLFRFGSGRSSSRGEPPSPAPAPAHGLRPPTAGSSDRHDGSAAQRPAQINLEDKVQKLPNDMQETFHRLLGDMYSQETETMIRFIEEARRSLALSLDELSDEQQVLSLTSNKIAEDRLKSATSDGRPKTGDRPRIGAQTARHRRTTPQPPPPPPLAPPLPLAAAVAAIPRLPRSKSNVSRGAILNPLSLTPRPTTASRGATAGLTASLDRVTFESEMAAKGGPQPGGAAPSPRTAFAVPYDPFETDARLNKEYEEEKEAIMKSVSGAHSRLDTERERQAALFRDRKEQQKVKQQRTEEKAMALVREVTAVEEKQLKDKERQEQLVREKLEERRRRKQGDEEEADDDGGGTQRRGPTPTVVNVASAASPPSKGSGAQPGPKKKKKSGQIEDLE